MTKDELNEMVDLCRQGIIWFNNEIYSQIISDDN